MVLGKSVSRVYSAVSLQPKSMYIIARESGCCTQTAGAALYQLEREGKVVREPVTNQKGITVEGWRKADKITPDHKVKA